MENFEICLKVTMGLRSFTGSDLGHFQGSKLTLGASYYDNQHKFKIK